MMIMAVGCVPASFPLRLRPSPPLLPSGSPLRRVGYPGRRPASIVASAPGDGVQKEEIVVVGAGIAGLATAVSLSRLGVRSLVLEQGESLRAGGTSLTLLKNGWCALDALGVGDDLRPQYLQMQGVVVRSDEGTLLRSFMYKDVDASQEARPVERRVLLETLASRLPSDSIRFSSKLKAISREGTDGTLLELVDGTRLLAKIVIGCDGARSLVAKWMGFPSPNYVGHCAFRGIGLYPEGHTLEHKVNHILGKGVRAGIIPVSTTKVYWFVCINSPTPGPRNNDPRALKKEVQELVKTWPSEIVDVIARTPESSVLKTPLMDRWLWPLITPPASVGGTVVVGDAWHPMTPNLGQGACCALEDAVVLGGKLASAITSRQQDIDKVLNEYSKERWSRVFLVTIRANLFGSILLWGNPAVCAVRDGIAVRKLFGAGLEHTNFDLESAKPVSAM